MSTKQDRIAFELPAVPHSLRLFIEKAVRDDHFMLAFVESPIFALRASGVPIKTESLTRSDCDRLIRVMGQLRNLVASGKIAKDFRFEQVFTIGANVEYEHRDTHEDTFIEKNFDHSQEGRDSERSQQTEEGIKTNFKPLGLPERPGEEIVAPLLSPGDLAAIVMQMQAKINVTYRG